MLNDADLRAYLLGQATDADAGRIEALAVEDEDVFATLGSVEDDLFDDYARGALEPAERQLFLARYGADRSRLLAARALAERTARAGVVPAPIASPSFRYWTLAAAAALTGVAVAAGIRSRPMPANSPPATAVSTNAASVSVALLLTLSTSRSAASPPEAVLPSSAAALELHVRIDPADVFDTYTMELRSDRGVLIWSADGLKASPADGNPTIVGNVPAALLTDTSYELAVRGANPGSTLEALGFAALKVRR